MGPIFAAEGKNREGKGERWKTEKKKNMRKWKRNTVWTEWFSSMRKDGIFFLGGEG
jgi:hypothetical protein